MPFCIVLGFGTGATCWPLVLLPSGDEVITDDVKGGVAVGGAVTDGGAVVEGTRPDTMHT